MSMPSGGRGRRWLKRAGVALAGAVVAEGLAAWAWPSPPVDRRPFVRVKTDPTLGYRLVPGQESYSYQAEVRTNALGLRERPIEALHPGRTRVVFLGGSETFGKGVAAEETFARRIETAQGDLWSINAGAPDYVLRQSLVWLKVVGPQVLRQGDRVVLTLFWDDLREDDSVRFPPAHEEKPAAQVESSDTSEAASDEWFVRRWARQTGLLEYVAPLYTRSRILYVVRNRAKLALGRFRNTRWVRWQDGLQSDDWPEDLREAFVRGGNDLEYFAELCAARSYRPTVLVLPQLREIEVSEFPGRLRAGWMQQTSDLGLLALDLTDAFRAAHRSGIRTHIPYDGAPSADGHRVIAEAVLRAWVKD